MVRFTVPVAFAASAVLLAATASGSQATEKHVVLPIHKGRSGVPVSAKAIVERDLARLAHFNGKPASHSLEARATGSGSATNEDASYSAAVKICGTIFHLTIDTGSSNLWVNYNYMAYESTN